MSHKIDPILFRLGLSKENTAKWYQPLFSCSKSLYAENLATDLNVRKYLSRFFYSCNLAFGEICLERTRDAYRISITADKFTIINFRKSDNFSIMNLGLKKLLKSEPVVDFREVKKPELDAGIVARDIAQKIANRMSVKKVMKNAVENAMKASAVGIKIQISGRINGVEIATRQVLKNGCVPLSSIRATIDYAKDISKTQYGTIGIKVYICLKKI